jgi:phosphohistidine swiveling domain-containing protein
MRSLAPALAADHAIGGKARSLARLEALGLPVPSGFAIDASLFRALRTDGPALPAQLVTANDLAALDGARTALLAAPLPQDFQSELISVLDYILTAENSTREFVVRSSAATEDNAGALGAGIYLSLLRVPRAAVGDAIRQVLASCLTPAAWIYTAPRTTAGDARAEPQMSALIHAFIEGDTSGTAACSVAPGPLPGAVNIEATDGKPSTAARATIDAAVRRAAIQYGPVELEWVANGDQVTFLQLRAYASAPARAVQPLSVPDGWTWDAAHNPRPLSCAQTGLVELVDARCRTGIRQQVLSGYLFYRSADPPDDRPSLAPPPLRARDAFERLRVDVDLALAALADPPSLDAALELFVTAYEPLFGTVAPACTAARRALTDFLNEASPAAIADLPTLLQAVPSAATRRRQAADAIARATDGQSRQAAMDSYVSQFGHESPCWDVAEPTLRETPARLLLLGAHTDQRPHDDLARATTRANETAQRLKQHLTSIQKGRFDELLVNAREAVGVGEDDDALYARLQACVRAALLGLGGDLVAAGQLTDASDVFHLPLSVSQAMNNSARQSEGDVPDLRSLVDEGKQALSTAALVRPVAAIIGTRILHGRGGAPGRLLGRAVHHPPSAPLGDDAVLIADTVLPTQLPLLNPAAIVVETGSILGHVASQARERGIPAVVGAIGACAAIPEGALVVVDGDRGEVVLLSPPDL